MEKFETLEGVFNFRDAGGCQTVSGQSVKRGCLFRSGQLSAATDSDLARLSDLNISLLFDLRGQAEQQALPNRLPEVSRPKTISLPIWPIATNAVERALLAGNIREFGASSKSGGLDTPSAMRNFYRSYIRDHQVVWSRMLQQLARHDSAPVLMHCAGGKDRTGVGVAIVLRALGVPDETIIEDYLLTNEAVDRWIAKDHPDGLPTFFLSVMRADPSYLHAALSCINEDYGSFESFLRAGLQFSSTQQDKLHDAFVS